MAYKVQRDDETIIKFEKGKWDSFWGYQCPRCLWIIGDPTAAHDHENAANCEPPPESPAMTPPTCPKHPGVPLICPACAGSKGGAMRSAKKTRAARRNATRPRPRKE